MIILNTDTVSQLEIIDPQVNFVDFLNNSKLQFC